MTDVSDAVPEAAAPDRNAPTGAPRPALEAADAVPPHRHTIALWIAAIASLVAIVCAAALPFAPVAVNEPTVSWPVNPDAPTSTLLNLTAYRPLQLDVRFSCEVARLAGSAGGTVVSTALPDLPQPIGLRVTSRDGRVHVRANDTTLLDEPIPSGPCRYIIAGSATGRPIELPRGGASPVAHDTAGMAGPTDALLTVTRDGHELARHAAAQLPDIDVIATSLTALPPSATGQLMVQMRVDDEFVSSPTPTKTALIVAAVVALLVVAGALARLDHAVDRVPALLRLRLPRVVDVVVPAVMAVWMIVAPATDDDGYYSAMAHNARLTGEVGNYYQLYNQSFTPFTWFYQALGTWQELAGVAPVAQRVPALIFGLLTWLLLRRFSAAAMAEWARDRRWVGMVTRVVLAAAFLAWWVPLDMGVRPESVVAVFAAATMVAVLAAARRRRLLYAFAAFALAGLGFAAHPTGFTLLAPLLAGLPLLWPVIRVPGSTRGGLVRAVAVVAGGMTALLAAFADGALRDFLRGQAIFLAIQDQESWATEFTRYAFLLSSTSAMGNFAKRSAILVCLVALVWFAALVAAARARRVVVPIPLWFAGLTTALTFAALWLTPSKWTHHFGALSGVGPAFLALFLVITIPLLREVLHDASLPIGITVAAAGSFVVAIALAWHGPNLWPYAYLEGLRLPGVPPAVKNVPLGSVTTWLAVLAAALGALALVGRLRHTRDMRLNLLRAVPLVVVLSLLGTAAYTVGIFANAARHGLPQASIWARNLADPTGAQCGAAGVIHVLDPSTSTPLPRVDATPTGGPPVGFVEGAGFAVDDPPITPAQVWGSLVARDGRAPESTVGQIATGWYQMPGSVPDGGAVTVLGAGTLSDGNTLTATFGRLKDGAITELGRQQLADTARDPAWRTMILRPPAGADVVRLDAVDGSAYIHGWVAFSAPEIQRPTLLSSYLPIGAPVALGWQTAFNYPCLRQPRVVDGITEPASYAVTWGNRPLSGLSDNIWSPDRGGLFAQIPRSQSVQQLATVDGTDPTVQVYIFGSPLARDAYTVTTTTRIQDGASTTSGTGPPGMD